MGKCLVMLKGTRPKATWNDDDIICAQRVGNGIGNEAETPVIKDFLCKGADLPIELCYEVHRLETRERVVNADQVQSCHPVENNECRLHGDLPVEHTKYFGVVRGDQSECVLTSAGCHLSLSISAKTSLATRIASNAAGTPQ